jgi:LPS O-antigen subunit length determinant protein (WzzB/FepE family)
MNDVQRPPIRSAHEVDVVYLWWAVWDQKILVAGIAALCTLLALILALTMTPVYRGTIIVAPVTDKGLGNDSSLGSLGGIASLAGIDIGMDSAKQERAAVLQSRHLVEEFVRKPEVSSELYARARKDGLKDANSVWKTTDRFRRTVLDIQPDKLKGTTTITMDWTDPAVAARWANGFVALANDLVRNKDIADSTRNVEYLNQQLDKTSSVNIQKVLYSLIEQETKTLMLAHGRVEYAFLVVDPAVTPEIRVRPWRSLIVLSGIVIGTFLGCFVVYCRTRFARPKRSV